MKPTWLTTEPREPPFPAAFPSVKLIRTPGNLTDSALPRLISSPPMPRKIFLLASAFCEARCQWPMVTPVSLNGNGWASAVPAASVEASNKAGMIGFMGASLVELMRFSCSCAKVAPALCKRDHAGPPLRIGSDIDVVLAREGELAICAYPEHGQAGRQVYHLAVFPPRAGRKRTGDQHACAR